MRNEAYGGDSLDEMVVDLGVDKRVLVELERL